MIVNQRFVTMFFPNDDPIGRRIRLTAVNSPETAPPAWATIVGMSPSPTSQGYYLVASDGGLFNFGDVPFVLIYARALESKAI